MGGRWRKWTISEPAKSTRYSFPDLFDPSFKFFWLIAKTMTEWLLELSSFMSAQEEEKFTLHFAQIAQMINATHWLLQWPCLMCPLSSPWGFPQEKTHTPEMQKKKKEKYEITRAKTKVWEWRMGTEVKPLTYTPLPFSSWISRLFFDSIFKHKQSGLGLARYNSKKEKEKGTHYQASHESFPCRFPGRRWTQWTPDSRELPW